MKSNKFFGQLKVMRKNVEWVVNEMNRLGVQITVSTMYKKLRGASEFTAPEIKAICEIMEYSKDEMYDIFFAELVS